MTSHDRFFVGICFALSTFVLAVVQLITADAIGRIHQSSNIDFPTSMDVVVKNTEPLPVELHPATIYGPTGPTDVIIPVIIKNSSDDPVHIVGMP